MKRLLGSIILASLMAFGNVGAQDKAVITGRVLNPLARGVYYKYLKTTVYYSPVSSMVRLNEDQTFRIEIPMTEPFAVDWRPKKNWVKLFLEPGDSLYIEVDMERFEESLTFSGKGADNCKYFYSKEKAFRPVRFDYKNLDTETFCKQVDGRRDSLMTHLEDGRKKYQLSSAFVNYCQAELDYEWANRFATYPINSRRGFHDDTLPDDFYDFYHEVDLINENAMHSFRYRRFLENYVHHRNRQNRSRTTRFSQLGVKRVREKTLQGGIFETVTWPGYVSLYEGANRDLNGRVKFYLQAGAVIDAYHSGEFKVAEVLFDDFKMFNPYTEYKALVESQRQRMLRLEPGHLAPSFGAENLDGQEVSLEDFSGEIVFLSFWINDYSFKNQGPLLTSVMSEFEDKSVVFLNLSLARTEETWREAINKHALGGTHIYAENDAGAKVREAYNLRGGPFFFLLDRDGMIVKRFIDEFDPDEVAKQIQDLLAKVGEQSNDSIK